MMSDEPSYVEQIADAAERLRKAQAGIEHARRLELKARELDLKREAAELERQVTRLDPMWRSTFQVSDAVLSSDDPFENRVNVAAAKVDYLRERHAIVIDRRERQALAGQIDAHGLDRFLEGRFSMADYRNATLAARQDMTQGDVAAEGRERIEAAAQEREQRATDIRDGAA